VSDWTTRQWRCTVGHPDKNEIKIDV